MDPPLEDSARCQYSRVSVIEGSKVAPAVSAMSVPDEPDHLSMTVSVGADVINAFIDTGAVRVAAHLLVSPGTWSEAWAAGKVGAGPQ